MSSRGAAGEFPLTTPSIPELPKLVTGAESAWASRTGLDITAEEFEDAIGHDADGSCGR